MIVNLLRIRRQCIMQKGDVTGKAANNIRFINISLDNCARARLIKNAKEE